MASQLTPPSEEGRLGDPAAAAISLHGEPAFGMASNHLPPKPLLRRVPRPCPLCHDLISRSRAFRHDLKLSHQATRIPNFNPRPLAGRITFSENQDITIPVAPIHQTSELMRKSYRLGQPPLRLFVGSDPRTIRGKGGRPRRSSRKRLAEAIVLPSRARDLFVAATTPICYYSYESSECAPRLEYFNFMLHDDELHVWRVGLELADDDFAEFSNLLSTDEHRRAARFHFENDRRRFTAGRGALRCILRAIPLLRRE